MGGNSEFSVDYQRFQALIRNLADVITIHAADGTTVYESPSAARVFGYGENGLIGRAPFDAIHPKDVGTVERVFADLVAGVAPAAPVEFRYRHAEGRWIDVEAIGTSLLHDPGIRGVVLTSRDISHRKLAEGRVRRAAHYDSLTGLPNRVLMRDRLIQALAHAQRRGEPVAVLFVDLDQFKKINDSLGHHQGDNLLVEVAARLRQCVREMDTLSRIGGDEFTLLLPHAADPQGIAVVAQKILRACGTPFDLDGQQVHISASIGISVYPGDGASPDLLLRNADTAMYAVKAQGRNGFRFFTPDLNQRVMENLRLEAGLRTSLAQGGFWLEYQPKIDLATHRVAGVEALLRWRAPSDGAMIPPSRFIPVAEDTGLILPIGEWVLNNVCQAIAAWRTRGYELPVAMNCSPRQFRQRDLGGMVRRALELTGAAPHCLEIEITESVFVEDDVAASRTLEELRRIGVNVSVDDFGTGYASLHYLKRLPIDILKIDRCFVDGIERDASNAAIVEAIITLSSQLGIRVVAEGVETADQAAALSARGCTLAQGFYFSPPVGDDALAGLLSARFSGTSGLI